MIHTEGWAFLAALPSYSSSSAIDKELRELRESGDRYIQLAMRLTGAMCLCAVALIAAVFLEHPVLSQVAFVVVALAWGWKQASRDKFDKEWRRVCFLHGYTAAQLGKSPYPDG